MLTKTVPYLVHGTFLEIKWYCTPVSTYKVYRKAICERIMLLFVESAQVWKVRDQKQTLISMSSPHISLIFSPVICKVTVLILAMTTSPGCYKMQMKSWMCKNFVNCKILSNKRHWNDFSGASNLSQDYPFHIEEGCLTTLKCYWLLECQDRFSFSKAWAQTFWM